jgi:SAM-dependent methyltransferase
VSDGPGLSQTAVTRQFFAERAEGWEKRFPDDGPAFAAAVRALRPPLGATALDAGCGTGRALPFLGQAVGASGRVIGVDFTPEMLKEAGRLGRRQSGALVMADVRQLPLPDGSVDAVLGSGLLPHLADPVAGLTELARVTRAGGRLALFHPIGRAALAARHGRAPDPGDIRAEPAIRSLLTRTGWHPELVDDGAEHYLVLAVRGEAARSDEPARPTSAARSDRTPPRG